LTERRLIVGEGFQLVTEEALGLLRAEKLKDGRRAEEMELGGIKAKVAGTNGLKVKRAKEGLDIGGRGALLGKEREEFGKALGFFFEEVELRLLKEGGGVELDGVFLGALKVDKAGGAEHVVGNARDDGVGGKSTGGGESKEALADAVEAGGESAV
jgi:hypothetical protein